MQYLTILWIFVTAAHLASFIKGDKESKVVGLVGESADLACDVDVSTCGKVYFITWTKNISNEWKRLYLYSDAVEKPLQELANPDRADFHLKETTSFLRISPLRIEDDGVYKCDVTYVQGKCPSLSFAILVMHAEPSAPVIEKDGKVAGNGSIVGPFYEGASLELDCETVGGKPTPEVTWFKGDEELESESRVTVEKNGASSVISTVKLMLDREDLGTKVECRVDNEVTDVPLVSWVEIDLHVGPSGLEIMGPTIPVTAGDIVPFICSIEGAKPAATALWYNRSEVLQILPQTETYLEADKTFKTVSTVKVPISRHDHLGTYYCKGTNSVLQTKAEAPLLKSLDIQVLYPPAIIVQPSGGALVNESDSAVIYCTYEANPFNITNVLWYHEDELLNVPKRKKYEISTQGYPTLTVRNVQKEDRGMYSCSMENVIGQSNSTNEVELNVLFPPIVQAMLSPEDVKEGDSISLFCDILEGNPQNLLKVRWFKDGELLHETTEREIVWVGVTRNTSGLYSCEGENAAGWGGMSEVRDMLVRFLPGPATLLEMDPPPLRGESSSLRCIVDDPGLPVASIFRWERDGDLLATTVSENYTTEPHRLLTRGNYSCAAVNEVGVGPRGYSYLAVKAPPRFIEDLPDIHGASRDAPFINFLCRVECDPLCDVHWKCEDEIIDDSPRYIIRNKVMPEDGPNNRFLSVTSTLQFNMTAWPSRRLLKERDRANYTCYSTGNAVGSGVSSTMLFQVEFPPEQLSLSESRLDVIEGRVPEAVQCTASSWPPSTYLWKKADVILGRESYLAFNDSVDKGNAGIYICVAENSHGRAQIEMKMNVLYKPECFIKEDMDESGDMILVCTADGNPSFINFTWIKDNETLENDYEMNEEGSQSVYVLPASDRFGLYSCIAINDIGESDPCVKLVDGPGLAGWHGEFGDKSVLLIAAIIGGVAILFVLVIIAIIIIMRKRRQQSVPSPRKPALGGGEDNLYQNVTCPPTDRKQNGPPVSETEGNVMYENMPFHRQGSNPSYAANRLRQSMPSEYQHDYQNVPYTKAEWLPAVKGNGQCGDQVAPSHQIQRGAPSFQRNENHKFTDPLRQHLNQQELQQQYQQSPLKREPCPQHGHREVDHHMSWGRSYSRENGRMTQNCPAAVIYADLALPSQASNVPAKRAPGTQYATLKFSKEHAVPTGEQ